MRVTMKQQQKKTQINLIKRKSHLKTRRCGPRTTREEGECGLLLYRKMGDGHRRWLERPARVPVLSGQD